MRRIYLPTLFLSMVLLSCNSDQDLFEIVQSYEDDPIIEDEASPNSPEEIEEQHANYGGELAINTDPCGYNLQSLADNDTLSIDCQIDLQGTSINLPNNINLLYDGGEIINGTLIFNSGTIDTKLLNVSLKIKGDGAIVADDFFLFPERWALVQGITSDENAMINKVNLLKAFNMVHDLGGTLFEVDEFDGYFNVHNYLANAEDQAMKSLLLPKSNFHLKMSDNTYLRVQPNGSPSYNLVSIFEGTNIQITGGNLLGDRWEHDYSPVNDIVGRPRNSHGWGHVLKVIGGKDILIENVYLANAAADNFGVHGSSIRNADGSAGNSFISEYVIMRNCVLEDARRNGMSILDGNNILIENCEIKKTGLGPVEDGINFGSGGTSPRYGISFEAYRERTSTGELLEYNRIENVTLRGNNFENNYAGDVVLYTCSNITIEDNSLDSKVDNIAAHDIIIRNNIFKARLNEQGEPYNYGISIGSNISEWDGEFTYNYQIYGNTIDGYGNGMILGGENFEVHNNLIVNCKNALGIEDKLFNGEFYNNEITSTVPYAIAYFSRGAELKNVGIRDEIINVEYRPINFRKVNSEINDPFRITDSELISISNKANFVENSSNMLITDNILNTDITINNSQNIVVTGNTDPD